MANELTTIDQPALPATGQPKWLTPTETSALMDRGTMLAFSPRAAVTAFEPARLRELVLRYEAALMPADDRKLAQRLRALWESTTAPGNLSARTWLHEAGRLLGDLPYGIARRAMDQAVVTSDRGFTPSIAAIRALAEPMLAELRRNASRLRAVLTELERPAEGDEPQADHPHAAGPLDHLSTAEILQRAWPTMAEHEATPARAAAGGLDPERPCRTPTRDDYLAMGIDPAGLTGEIQEAA